MDKKFKYLFTDSEKKPVTERDIHVYAAHVEKCAAYLAEHFTRPLTVSELADHAGISRSQLYRAFMAVLGKTPKEYLTSYRIRKACLLLKQSDLPVSEVAAQSGFESCSYFSKAFKKAIGTAPLQYRHSGQ